MEHFDLRHAGSVELATGDGSPVSREAVLHDGLLRIGQQLLAERAKDDRLGRPHRRLKPAELRALMVAEDVDIAKLVRRA